MLYKMSYIYFTALLCWLEFPLLKDTRSTPRYLGRVREVSSCEVVWDSVSHNFSVSLERRCTPLQPASLRLLLRRTTLFPLPSLRSILAPVWRNEVDDIIDASSKSLGQLADSEGKYHHNICL